MSKKAGFGILLLGSDPERMNDLERLLSRPERVIETLDLGRDFVARAKQEAFCLAVVDGVSLHEGAVSAIRLLRQEKGLAGLPILLIIRDFEETVLPIDLGPVDLAPMSPEIVAFRVDLFIRLREQEQRLEHKDKKVTEVQQRLEEEIRFHRETERVLTENEQTLRRILRSIEASSEAILVTEKNEIAYYINPAFTELTGLSEDAVIGARVEKVFRIHEAPVDLDEMKRISRATGRWQGEVELTRQDGRRCQAAMDVNAVDGLDGRFEGFIFILRDISSLKKIMAELERLARTDSLTSLLNRRHFIERFQEEMKRVKRYGAPMSVLLLDLDRFKRVNDTHGHAAGDKVLEQTGAIIRDVIRSMDFACRYGGEEFCVALPDTALEGGLAVAERLRGRIEAARFRSRQGEEFQVTCSIGLTRVDEGSESWEASFSAVDKALYRAKRNGRNRVERE